MEKIFLSELFNELGDLKDYKLHFAKMAGGSRPLDVFMQSYTDGSDDWKNWNRWSNGKDEFNRKYIFSLIQYHLENDTWLFGGIWEVIDKEEPFPRTEGYPYTIKLCDAYKKFIGRLKITYAHKDRSVRNRMENYFPDLVVKELLDEVVTTYEFRGHKNLDVLFKDLEQIYRSKNGQWENALSVKGIYLITDVSGKKRYVGKASGKQGIWQRWRDYIETGHGGDIELKKLVTDKGFEYVRDNYKFTLLEIVNAWDEKDIDDRETYWKEVLLTRSLDDYNRN